MTGYWTWEQAQQWRDAGIGQWFITAAVTRRPQAWRGAKRTYRDQTSFRYGLQSHRHRWPALEDLPLFKGIPIHVFIAGRASVMPLLRLKLHVSSNVPSPTVGLRSGYVVQTNPAWHL